MEAFFVLFFFVYLNVGSHVAQRRDRVRIKNTLCLGKKRMQTVFVSLICLKSIKGKCTES